MQAYRTPLTPDSMRQKLDPSLSPPCAHLRGRVTNWSQMGIKTKTCDIRTWKKHLFLDISSTNIDTLVPSLYQCVETRIIEVL
jgi:hypothetical protein